MAPFLQKGIMGVQVPLRAPTLPYTLSLLTSRKVNGYMGVRIPPGVPMKPRTEEYNAYYRAYMRLRRATDIGRKEYRRTDKARNLAFRQWLAELKDRPCDQCGGRFPSYVMQFHHRNSATKRKTVSEMAHSKREEVLEEIGKCDILCANCHAIKTHQGEVIGNLGDC